jgi:preprotein translocase subunit SecG
MDWLQYIFGPLLFITSAFLIMIVLLQRGKGGGLVGALGGSGGQSAFGTKFGDRLMWVTYGVAVFWILLILASILLLSKTSDPFANDGKSPKRTTGGELSPDPSAEDKSKETDSKDAAMGAGETKTDAKEGERDTTSRFSEGANAKPGEDAKAKEEKPADQPEANKTEEKRKSPLSPLILPPMKIGQMQRLPAAMRLPRAAKSRRRATSPSRNRAAQRCSRCTFDSPVWRRSRDAQVCFFQETASRAAQYDRTWRSAARIALADGHSRGAHHQQPVLQAQPPRR